MLTAIGIRYGKYCGVGWSGCPGEKPCDDLDACCKVHDDCVGQKGILMVHKSSLYSTEFGFFFIFNNSITVFYYNCVPEITLSHRSN